MESSKNVNYLKSLSMNKEWTTQLFSSSFCEHLYTPFNCYCMYCNKLTHPKNTCQKCGKYRLVDEYEIIKEYEWNDNNYLTRSFHIETDRRVNSICSNCIITHTNI